MKNTATVFVSAMLILSSCDAVTSVEPEQSETTSQTTTVVTSTSAVEMPASQQNEGDYEIYETDGVSYHVPDSWKFVNTDNESKEYKKFKADDFSFSVQFHEDYSLDISMPDSDIITALERKYTKASVIQLKHFNVGENDCIYFVCRDEGKAEGSEVVKLACQSKNGEENAPQGEGNGDDTEGRPL